MSFNIKGLGNLEKQLKNIEKKVKETVNGSVKMKELFPEDFMKKHTNFSTIEDFWENSPFQFETKEEFDLIEENELDEYVKQNTSFSTWAEMMQLAGKEYISKKLK